MKESLTIKRVNRDGTIKTTEDEVAVDTPFCIFVDDLPFRTLIASPGKLRELAMGHLFTEGIIKSLDDIEKESVRRDRADIWLKEPVDLTEARYQRDRVLTTACNTENILDNSVFEDYRVQEISSPENETVFDLVHRLNRETSVYRATGGTHSAILQSQDGLFSDFAEDVGRHNAVDKVLGAGLIGEVSFQECMLATSGRLSGEIVLKAARAGVPIVCSVSAPLLSGVRVAEQTGIRLYGFVRGNRLNDYSRG